jgi:hypothetical protein
LNVVERPERMGLCSVPRNRDFAAIMSSAGHASAYAVHNSIVGATGIQKRGQHGSVVTRDIADRVAVNRDGNGVGIVRILRLAEKRYGFARLHVTKNVLALTPIRIGRGLADNIKDFALRGLHVPIPAVCALSPYSVIPGISALSP